MSGYIGDLGNYFNKVGGTGSSNPSNRTKAGSTGYELEMSDFLTLMVTELTNQSIDSTADTSDMLNQMVQMQMVQALVNMTDASLMGYTASLVGKNVTVGQYDADGNLHEIYGEVTGTGTMNGQQVVFVNDKYYYLNEIMAVGKLPKLEETGETEDSNKTEESVEETGKTEETAGTESGGSEEQGEAAEPEAPEQ